jgi:hypothetical protein
MWLPLVMQGVSKIALQCYSKCYCVARITKTFILKAVQTIRRSASHWRMDNLYVFKCKRFRNTTQWYLEYHCKVLFETPCIGSTVFDVEFQVLYAGPLWVSDCMWQLCLPHKTYLLSVSICVPFCAVFLRYFCCFVACVFAWKRADCDHQKAVKQNPSSIFFNSFISNQNYSDSIS